MAYRFNIFSGTLDIVGTGGSGGGNVTGVPPITVTAITRWASLDGTVIENSLALLQDGGAIEAQGFITMRPIINQIIVNPGESWLAPSIELELSGAIEIEENGELIIV
jgi:hypothetical protein